MADKSNKENAATRKRLNNSTSASSNTRKFSGNSSMKNNFSNTSETNCKKVKKAKSKFFFKGRKVKAQKDMSASGSNPYPNLVPTKGIGFNLSKKLLTQVYVKELTHSIYHVWLNCLWNNNVSYEDIIGELRPIFMDHQRPRAKDIFIVGCALNNDIVEPVGSCFILIDQKISKSKAQEFSMKIAANKFKMIEVNIAMLRNHIKNQNTLIFSRAHEQNLDTLPLKIILSACGIHKPVHHVVQTLPQVKIIPTTSDSKEKEPEVKQKLSVQPIDTNIVKEQQTTHKKGNTKLEPKESIVKQEITVKQEPASLVGGTQPARRKSNRIAALLGGSVKSQPVKQEPRGYAAFEAMLATKVEADSERSYVVTRLLPQLIQFGDLVIKIDHLPSHLTVYAFNLMMGTWSIKTDQMIAFDTSTDKNGRSLMTLRLVIQSNDPDAQKILTKNRFKTAYDTILQIQKTNFKELERFLLKHHDKIRKLELDDILPMNNISANPNYPLNFNHVPKWATGYLI